MKKLILFLCTHNSARSQMAEGLARALRERSGVDVEIWSAGTEARGVHPLAVRAMVEADIDISGQRSKTLSEVPFAPDYVITLCDEAAEACPFFSAKTKTLHWGFPDPWVAHGTEMDRLAVFRDVRDQISRKLREFWETEFSPPSWA